MSVDLDSNCHFVQSTCPGVQIERLKLDPITDLFQTMQIVSVVHARLEATAPWGLKTEADVAEEIAEDKHLARAAGPPFHFAHFGMLARGSCWLSVEGIQDPIPLAGGDCFLLAPGNSYSLQDNPR